MSDGSRAQPATMFSQEGPDDAARAVLDSLPCFVAFMNLAGDVPYANPAFTKVGSGAGPTGTGWATMLHPDDVERAATHRELQLQSETSIPLEVRMSNGDGGWVTLAVGYWAIRGDRGALVGWLATAIVVDGMLRIDD